MMGDQVIWITIIGLLLLPVAIKFVYWLFTGKWPKFEEDRLPNWWEKHDPIPGCGCAECQARYG